MLAAAEREAVKKIMAFTGKFIKKMRGDIKYHALIDRSIVDNRAVQFSGMNQEQISRKQLILFSLNDVAYIASQENHDFMEIMIVEGEADAVLVRDVKQFETTF